MKFRVLPAMLFSLALPALAQYAGPAILTRGEAPSALVFPDLRFRPYLTVTGSYTTRLAWISLDDQGGLPTVNTSGTHLAWGISGVHSIRRTKLGLNYRGSFNHYNGTKSTFDSLDNTLLIGFQRQVSRHIQLVVNQTAGIVSRDFGLLGLSQAVPFDPATTSLPTTDYFNNRTVHLGTQASVVIQKTARLSFNLGGGIIVTRRQSKALTGHTGERAHGDVQYRLSRRMTIGANYGYGRNTFTRVFGGTILQSAVGSFGMQLSRQVEFSGFAGVMRPEITFLRSVPLDPVIQALLGVSSGTRVFHRVFYTSYLGGRLSKTVRDGVLFVSLSRGVNPGNGLFLTSLATTVSGGYAYTGLRRWSLTIGGFRTWAESISNITGNYQTTTGRFGIARTLRHGLHFTTTYTVRQYGSRKFTNYNRQNHNIAVGFSWSPGEVPLRIW